MKGCSLTSLEVCAGAGGQALGLEKAGFQHLALVETDADCRATLRYNRPEWLVPDDASSDLRNFDGTRYHGADLLAGGLPCPPFSIAGKQLGAQDDRNLFPDFLRVVDEVRPSAIMIENVRGILSPKFADFRATISDEFRRHGYVIGFRLFQASEFGVAQLRPRVVIAGLRASIADRFVWPEPTVVTPPTVGEVLADLMGSRGWPGADDWSRRANGIAPTLVGGSKKHGGPDLGPTRARNAWALLGVDGRGVVDDPPGPEQTLAPRLTVRMAARLQGFPDDWHFSGRRTSAYRQVGNAFPPPVAAAVGASLAAAIATPAVRAVA
jgi:DNA (cytosine-5)-methyltransferase 1